MTMVAIGMKPGQTFDLGPLRVKLSSTDIKFTDGTSQPVIESLVAVTWDPGAVLPTPREGHDAQDAFIKASRRQKESDQ